MGKKGMETGKSINMNGLRPWTKRPGRIIKDLLLLNL